VGHGGFDFDGLGLLFEVFLVAALVRAQCWSELGFIDLQWSICCHQAPSWAAS
jgi:hypothetical protein